MKDEIKLTALKLASSLENYFEAFQSYQHYSKLLETNNNSFKNASDDKIEESGKTKNKDLKLDSKITRKGKSTIKSNSTLPSLVKSFSSKEIKNLAKLNESIVEGYNNSFNKFFKSKDLDVYRMALEEFPITDKQLWMINKLIEIYNHQNVEAAQRVKYEEVYKYLQDLKRRLIKAVLTNKNRGKGKAEPDSIAEYVIVLAEKVGLVHNKKNLNRPIKIKKVSEILSEQGFTTTEKYISKILSTRGFYGNRKLK